ncbi:DNA-directed RNA polymerase subunit K [Candidatus Pacearchaeota archaeon CG06_land_8_20_14_3_00_35_12]|nr:MAG: DNA-directed RNA polymerase subunit K [Candidatus Pacearchaeota archaeon CG06_land_8_20_14_3_00_35_12]
MKKEEFDPEFYTKYEKTRIIGARALQLSMNAPILLKMSKEEMENLKFDPLKIAELEFNNGVLPITVRRPLPQRASKDEEEENEEIEVIEKVEEEEVTEKPEKLKKKEEKAEAAAEGEEIIGVTEETEEEAAPAAKGEVAE